jgi:hypothetical protein
MQLLGGARHVEMAGERQKDLQLMECDAAQKHERLSFNVVASTFNLTKISRDCKDAAGRDPYAMDNHTRICAGGPVHGSARARGLQTGR